MADQGLASIADTKENGLWETSKRTTIDDEQVRQFKQLLQPHEPAYANLLAMPRSVERTYTGFYLDAKSDKTRHARLEKIIDWLSQNLKPM